MGKRKKERNSPYKPSHVPAAHQETRAKEGEPRWTKYGPNTKKKERKKAKVWIETRRKTMDTEERGEG